MTEGMLTTLQALHLWQKVLRRTLKDDSIDFSARQMAILLEVYLGQGPHSIKSLSGQLGISKAAVCRAVDTLSMQGLLKRKKDEDDRRNVILQRTVQGSVYLSDFADVIIDESASTMTAEPMPESIVA